MANWEIYFRYRIYSFNSLVNGEGVTISIKKVL